MWGTGSGLEVPPPANLFEVLRFSLLGALQHSLSMAADGWPGMDSCLIIEDIFLFGVDGLLLLPWLHGFSTLQYPGPRNVTDMTSNPNTR